jgi:hypothetical protein
VLTPDSPPFSIEPFHVGIIQYVLLIGAYVVMCVYLLYYGGQISKAIVFLTVMMAFYIQHELHGAYAEVCAPIIQIAVILYVLIYIVIKKKKGVQ